MPVGFTQVSASALKDPSGALVANATISFYPVNNAGWPISFKAGGGGQVMSMPVTAPVVNGAFTIQLADTTLTTPINVGYSVAVTDNVTGKSLLGAGYGCVQPSGTTWNFDTYSPNLASLALTQYGPQGDSAYAIAVAGGFVGTQAQWIASLKGVPGDVSVATLGLITSKAVAAISPNGINLFDKSKTVTGALRADGTVQSALTGFQTSAFIPVGGIANIILNIIAYGSTGAPGFGLCFYNGDQTFLNCYSTTSTPANTLIPIPAGAGWLRFYMPVTSASGITPLVDVNTAMMAYGTLPSSYQAFGYVNTTILNSSVAISQSATLNAAVALLDALSPSVINLFDFTAIQLGYLNLGDQLVPAAPAFSTSAYINVMGLSFITSNIIVDVVPTSAKPIFYNLDKTPLATIDAPVAAGTPIPVPAGAVWFRFWIATASASGRPQWYVPSTVMLVNGSTLPASFKAFGYVTSDQLSSVTKPLVGKNWMPWGDSITAKMSGLYQANIVAATGVTIPSQDARGGRRADQIFEMFQVSGSPIATGDPVNGLSTGGIINTTLPQAAGDGSVAVGAVQINSPGPWPTAGQTLAQVLANVDIVTVFLGTNDTTLLSNLGAITDAATATTYYGYLRAAVEGFLKAKPSIRLVWVIPYKSAGLSVTNYPIVVTAIKAVCASYAVAVVDLSLVSGVNSLTSTTLLADTVHPTATGSNKMLAPCIKAGLLAQM